VLNASDLVRKVSSHSPGTTVKLELWRERAAIEVDVNLTERNVVADRKATEESVLGLKVRELSQSILERLGIVGSTKGVVVVEVEAGSPSEEARLTEGDIIIEVAQQPVTRTAAEPGKALLVRFIRGNNDPDITIIRVPKE